MDSDPYESVDAALPGLLGPIAWIFSALYFVFWLWMAVDCYRRRNGFDAWHLFFFLFPISTVLYFILHFRLVMEGLPSGAVFGPSLKKQIEQMRAQLRIADTIGARFELAELLYKNKQYPESEAEFRVVLAAEPNNLEAQYYIGLCRMHLNDAPGALPFLKQVVTGDRKIRMGLAWMAYTNCLLANNLREDALEERRKLSRAFPRPLTEYAYAELLHNSGQNEKARAILEDMLATSHNAPREDNPYLSKGRSLLKKVS